ncbi:GGDEF domain-containing protein [Altererythrobacter sp. GH1-8]|uniref:GGDEF domain-containing protein n=1 Tax=Altererythrobacter sp. GH1-8 TaxID=3349333 RepID=UPI00374DEA5A
MKEFILNLVSPTIAGIFAVVFLILWWRDREQRHVAAFAACYVSLATGLLISYFAPNPGGTTAVLTVHFTYSIGVLAMAWGAARRMGQRQPMLAYTATTAVTAAFLWYASLINDQTAQLYAENGNMGLLFALTAQSLWRASERNVIDRAIIWMFVLIAAQFFIRPLMTMMFEGPLTIEAYRASVFYSVYVLSLALLSLLLALALTAAVIADQLRTQEQRSETDPLSGLKIRRAFENEGMNLLDKGLAQGLPVSMIVADIDHFKQVNDIWGHQAGDRAIAAFGELIKGMVRSDDICGRIGGEEFCLMVWNCELGPAERLAERIRTAYAEMPHDGISPDVRLTASFGIASARSNEGFGKLFARADAALYRAKEAGRNRVFADRRAAERDPSVSSILGPRPVEAA